MERKLATIQCIGDINPIVNADAIEVVRVKGWNVVVKKKQFKIGDLCVYFEIDSMLPAAKWNNFLQPKDHVLDKIRLRTVKLRGQISQGLVIPLCDIFPDDSGYQVGDDVTTVLGVEKYEPVIPAHLSGLVKGPFPSFIHKTDEERIQNCVEILDIYKNLDFYITEKIDGTSMSVYFNNGEFGVCSRNLELKDDSTNSLWEMAMKLELKQKLKRYFDETNKCIALQGELAGPGIQGNKYKFSDRRFFIFNVFDITNHEYFSFVELVNLCKAFDLNTVPILNNNFVLNHSLDEIMSMSDDVSVFDKCPREGLVFRPLCNIKDPTLGRLSFKAISNKFLLYTGE